MKLLTGLFHAARRRLMVTDNDMGMFRKGLDELVAGKDTLSDEEIAAKVEELKGMTKDLPGDDDAAKLDRFLDDFKAIKEQDEATAKEAAGMVADLFEKLDTAAMQDVPAVEEPAAEPAAEEAPAEEAPAAGPEETLVESEAPAEETPAEEEAEDADPNPAYTLEEIYQFCKQRQAEDAAAEANADGEECQDEAPAEEEEKEEEEKEVVTDHAPHIPVTLNQSQKNPNGSLAAMFGEIKNGGR